MIPVKITQLSTNKNPIHLTLDVGWVEKYKTVTGNPIVISDGVKDTLLKKLQMTLAPKQSGSGTPSPDNVRPISGWDEVETVVSGKNLCDNAVFGTYGLVEQSDGSWYADNNNKIYDKVVWQNDRGIEGQLAIVFKYRYSNADYVGAYPIVYYTDGTHRNIAVTKTTETTEISTITQSGKTVDRIVMVYSSNGAQSYVNLMVTEDLTATSYEPYQGHTYTTDLPQTVYGGTLDVVSGVLTVDRAMVTLNTASMDNTEVYPGWKNSGVRNLMGAGLNNVYNDAQTNVGRGMGVNTIGSNDVLLLPKLQYDLTQSQWQALAIDAQIIVPLATPTTIQCDPQTVSLLAGENVVMGDGDMEITYRVKASA